MRFELVNTRAGAFMIGVPALLVVATTPVLLSLNSLLPLNLFWLGYLIPVILASVRWGFVGAVTAAVMAGIAGDYFFTQPYYSLWMDDSRDIAALLLFLLAAFGSAVVITRGAQANDREVKSTSDVHRLLLELSGCSTSRDVIVRFGQWMSVVANGRVMFIGARSVADPQAPVPGEIQRVAVELCGAKSDGVRTIVAAANKRWLLRQLRSEHEIHGILAVEIEGYGGDRRIVEAAMAGTAMRFSDLARRETVTAAAGCLLDGDFSQRWGSQITTILGAASVLQMRAQADATRVEHALLADIRDEAVHLGRLLRNAFSALRATVHGPRSGRDWIDPADLLASTLDQGTPCGSAAAIKATVEKDLPLVEIDPALFAEGCGQLLTDAFRSSPPGATIKVDVHRTAQDVVVTISRELADQHGERVATDTELHPQSPSCDSDPDMWIASSLVRAAGATIDPASPQLPYGTVATLRIPLRQASQPRLA